MRLYQIFLAKSFAHFRRTRDVPEFYWLLMLVVGQLWFFGIIGLAVIGVICAQFAVVLPGWLGITLLVTLIIVCFGLNFHGYIPTGRIYRLEERHERIRLHPVLLGVMMVLSWPISMVLGLLVAMLISWLHALPAS